MLGPDSLLIVGNDPAGNSMMIQRLSKRGFNASAVVTSKGALEWISAHTVDLALIDVEMPDVHGIDLLKTLRQNYSPAKMPIIMVTGRATSEDAVKALASGANDYVSKPIDFPVVLARIQTQLSRKHAEAALRESEERYALAARGANDGLWDWDLIAGKMHFSPRWKSMLGWEEHEISDNPNEWFIRIHPDDIERVRADISAHLEEATPHYEGEYRMLHRDGNYLWMLGRGLSVRNSSGVVCRMA